VGYVMENDAVLPQFPFDVIVRRLRNKNVKDSLRMLTTLFAQTDDGQRMSD